ncbi:hypothetical protein [Rhizobium sp. LC145]|jgi:hypothetical protein|uniref:hypothetical protein n=1 Tax=Rhizobium sp. LC145 TaxID=1120688 RepID=UPI000629FD10|nr:hypothetical protein [Rhizobium sp. LC145]KKX28011.1 hypothetical protein YH62_17975 [Rhizobium sp. LC145]TKT46320.1 hypothetical protein FDR95_22805 [Rhizobiaceae bacterium LC148]
MKSYLKSGIAATLLASAAFAGSAFAQSTVYGDRFDNRPSLNTERQNLDEGRYVDPMSTGSIDGGSQMMWRSQGPADTYIDGSQDRGDFYEGALRPQD